MKLNKITSNGRPWSRAARAWKRAWHGSPKRGALTTLSRSAASLYTSPIVSYVEEVLVDIDILKVRVYLASGEMFIDVFYNAVADKTSFALIDAGRRVYGADNAKMGWHKHPFDAAEQHSSCPPVTFAEFLADVEGYFQAQ